nr:hypothetical protein [Tanacetum cinerariifolium]
MQEELMQFKLQKVWTMVDLPNSKRDIRTKWVFRNKKDEKGIVVRNNARLVAQGYTKEEGIDYDEMDVKSAFLYGTIEEEVTWYETWSTYLLENEFRRGTTDKTLLIKKNRGDILLVHVYVDDIIFGSIKKFLCNEFKQMMHKRFQMSSIRELTFFLGLQVKQKDDGIFISQDKYAADILKKFNFTTVKTASTPMEPNKASIKDAEAEDVDVHLYRLMIGSLIYLKGQCKLILGYPRDTPFDLEAFLIVIMMKLALTGNLQQEVLWIQNQMLNYGFNFMNTKIYINNESTIRIVKNLVFHSKTKHIKIRHHFIRDSYEKKLIQDRQSSMVGFDKTVYKEWEDKMERVSTTASSLEVEQDSGSGPRCQVTILGGAKAQTRFEAPSKQSNDPPLSRVNTLGSGEDIMKLKKLMELYTKLFDIGLVLQGKGLTIPVQSHHTPSDEAASIGVYVRHRGAATNVSSLDAGHGSGNINKTPSMPYDLPLPRFHTLRIDERRMQHNELMDLVTKMTDRVLALETDLQQTKKVYNNDFTKLIIKEIKFETEDISTAKTLVYIRRNASKNIERKRIARVHEEASSFNVEEWEDIQATIEANKELALRIQAKEKEKYSNAEKAKLLVDLINQRKRHFDQQRAKERRNKPLTQAQQRTYMSNYVKHMGNHTLQQLKRLSFNELKNLFEATVKRVKTFTLMESDVDRTIPKISDESSKRAAEEERKQESSKR